MSLAVVSVLAQLGASDCERIGSGLLAQPANAVSSMAYVGGGLAIAVATGRRATPGARSYLFAGLVTAIGLGSVAFHGPQPTGARALHDLPIAIALLFMVLDDLDLLRPRPHRFARGLVAGTVVATVVAVALPDALMVLGAVLVLALVGTEALVYRRDVRPSSRRTQRNVYAAIAAVMGLALMFFWLGRTDNALCDPDAAVQGHGLWHLVSAAAFGLWWWLASTAADRPTTPVRDLAHPGPRA